MKNSFLRGLLYGIVLGAVGSLAIYRMTYYPTGIVTQPLVIQPAPCRAAKDSAGRTTP